MVSIISRKLTLKNEEFSHALYDSFSKEKKYFLVQEEADPRSKLKKLHSINFVL